MESGSQLSSALQRAGTAPLRQALLIASGALVGGLAGTLVSAGAYLGMGIGIAVAAALVIAPVLLLRPMWAFYLFVATIFILEEFPAGEGDTLERSIRLPFYAASLGIPGLNAPELLMITVLLLLVLYQGVAKRRDIVFVDLVGVCLLTIGWCAVFAVVFSFIAGDPFEHAIIMETTGLGFEMNERALQFIAFFQFKLFAYLFIAYLLGLVAFRGEPEIRRFAIVLGGASVAMIAIGVVRLIRDPAIVAEVRPLFYDSPTSWLFAIGIFFIIGTWAYGLARRAQLAGLTVLGATLSLFILLSFRRTMWAGIAIAGLMLVAFLPPKRRAYLLGMLALFGAILGAVLVMTPLQELVLAPLVARIGQTNVEDTSTLYRLALFVYFARHFGDIPFFGYGVEPLWNQIVGLGFFRTNLENVHSLYFWWWLRTGAFGMLVATSAVSVLLVVLVREIRKTPPGFARLVNVCVLLALVVLLFSGIFNPVYGQARYMIFTGLLLAAFSRLRRDRQAAA
jgi:hypothetical protein